MVVGGSSRSMVIADVVRARIAKFRGSFSSLMSGTRRSGHQGNPWEVPPQVIIHEAILSNVASAGMSQAPCRQVILFSGLPETTVSTTIN